MGEKDTVNYGVTMTMNDGTIHRVSFDENELKEDEGLEFIEGQLCVYREKGIFNYSYISLITDDVVFITLNNGTDKAIYDVNCKDFIPLYKNDKPIMAKKNMFGKYKKEFWK